jgi:hypothetical protein
MVAMMALAATTAATVVPTTTRRHPNPTQADERDWLY